MRFVYPNGKRKALTFSYDDGQIFDKRLAELLRSHGMKGTFHLNSGKLVIQREQGKYVAPEELAEVYAGHEIACHGVEHLNLPLVMPRQVIPELEEDRRVLEKLTGGMVQGLSYAFGAYNDRVKNIASLLGFKYSRTVQDTGYFNPPEDFMQWHPTCHHNNNLLALGDRFLDVPGFYELPLMYVWGHSYEFGLSDDWSAIEAFVEKMAYKDDIWYATNIEICNYVEAVRRQEFSADSMRMYNPTALSVWIGTAEGFKEVKPGKYFDFLN